MRKYALAAVIAASLTMPSAALANGHGDREHPGADKQVSYSHGDCKNRGTKGDTHDTTGVHNGYDCAGQPQQPPPCDSQCSTPPPARPCPPPPPPPCSCPTPAPQPAPAPKPHHRKCHHKHHKHKHHHRKCHHRRHHSHRRHSSHFLG